MKDEFHADGIAGPGMLEGVRKQGESEARATLGAMREGVPLPPDSEIVKVTPKDEPGVYGITSLYTHKGPARVASKAYRNGYDRVFGKSDKELN